MIYDIKYVMVFSTAEQTPLSALYAAALTIEAGFPPGVLNVGKFTLTKFSIEWTNRRKIYIKSNKSTI